MKMTERHKTQTNLSEMHIKLNAKNIQIIKDFIEIEWFFIQMIRFGELWYGRSIERGIFVWMCLGQNHFIGTFYLIFRIQMNNIVAFYDFMWAYSFQCEF